MLVCQDLKQWVQGKQEVEVVDMILRIRHKMTQGDVDEATREQLRLQIADMVLTLPDDLKTVLKAS